MTLRLCLSSKKNTRTFLCCLLFQYINPLTADIVVSIFEGQILVATFCSVSAHPKENYRTPSHGKSMMFSAPKHLPDIEKKICNSSEVRLSSLFTSIYYFKPAGFQHKHLQQVMIASPEFLGLKDCLKVRRGQRTDKDEETSPETTPDLPSLDDVTRVKVAMVRHGRHGRHHEKRKAWNESMNVMHLGRFNKISDWWVGQQLEIWWTLMNYLLYLLWDLCFSRG